jgi:hypothetical protein
MQKCLINFMTGISSLVFSLCDAVIDIDSHPHARPPFKVRISLVEPNISDPFS